MEEAKDILVERFQLTRFRGHQEAVIKRLLVEDKNTLAVMPTGAEMRTAMWSQEIQYDR